METRINIHISLLILHRLKISLQNYDPNGVNTRWDKNYSVWRKSIFWPKKTAGLTIMVFLEKLRKFKVCRNRFRIVYYDTEKQYEPALDKISRYFNRISRSE